jgi:hypothetical protein
MPHAMQATRHEPPTHSRALQRPLTRSQSPLFSQVLTTQMTKALKEHSKHATVNKAAVFNPSTCRLKKLIVQHSPVIRLKDNRHKFLASFDIAS